MGCTEFYYICVKARLEVGQSAFQKVTANNWLQPATIKTQVLVKAKIKFIIAKCSEVWLDGLNCSVYSVIKVGGVVSEAQERYRVKSHKHYLQYFTWKDFFFSIETNHFNAMK